MAYFGSLNKLTDKEVFIKGVVHAKLISCGDNFVTEGEGFGADVVDMESFAEYDVCQELGVPFFAIKYVTDVIGQNSMEIWEKRLADSRTALTTYFKNIQ